MSVDTIIFHVCAIWNNGMTIEMDGFVIELVYTIDQTVHGWDQESVPVFE